MIVISLLNNINYHTNVKPITLPLEYISKFGSFGINEQKIIIITVRHGHYKKGCLSIHFYTTGNTSSKTIRFVLGKRVENE